MSALVAELTERYPQVEIELVADTALNLREQLQKGFLDVILQTDLLRQESIRSLDLARYPMGWIVAAGSTQQHDYASLAELARERIITFSKNSRPHREVLSLLQAAGAETPRLNCVNSVAAITRLLRDGFGIGALPRRWSMPNLPAASWCCWVACSHRRALSWWWPGRPGWSWWKKW